MLSSAVSLSWPKPLATTATSTKPRISLVLPSAASTVTVSSRSGTAVRTAVETETNSKVSSVSDRPFYGSECPLFSISSRGELDEKGLKYWARLFNDNDSFNSVA